jgi:hypothetical protein
MMINEFFHNIIGPKLSLKRNLIVSICGAVVACMALAVVVLLVEFNEHIDSVKSENLNAEAKEVASHLNVKDGNLALGHSEKRLRSNEARFRYSIH